MIPITLAPEVASPMPDAPTQSHSVNASDRQAHDLAKLGKAAGEFEAILLNSLWESMKVTFSSEDGEGEDDPILKSFDDWGMQALSRAAGSAGSLGVKSMIMNHLGSLIGPSSLGQK